MRKKIGEYSFDETRLLGKGTYGSVYLGHHNKTHQAVAVKLISLETFEASKKKRLLDNFRNEVTNMQLAEGQNIVQLLAVQASERNLYLICEYCNGGSLDRTIKKERRLSEREALRIFGDIVKGFKCLHQNNIVHRDLKPANILLHNGIAKVGDFGFSKLIDDHDQMLTSLVGTPQYMSPQILSNCNYTEKTDIWSLGIILFEMLFGRVPWDTSSKDIDSVVKYIRNCSAVPIPEVPKISKNTVSLLQRMLQVEEAERMSWEELFNYESLRQHREETLSNEVKSLSLSSESQNEKVVNYAKCYFQSNKVVLDVNDLKNRSASNDLIKTIMSNGEGSMCIQTEPIYEKKVQYSGGSATQVEKVLSQRNQAVLLILIYLKLTDLIESGLLEVGVSEIGLQLLLLKQAFLVLFEIYKCLKQAQQAMVGGLISEGISWSIILTSEYKNSIQALASVDNTMCSLLFSSFLKKFEGARGNMQVIEEEDGFSEVLRLANKDFDRSKRTQHLMRKHMWHVLLKLSAEPPAQALKMCTLMGVYLKKLEQLSFKASLSMELAKLYDLVQTGHPQSMQKMVRDTANNLD